MRPALLVISFAAILVMGCTRGSPEAAPRSAARSSPKQSFLFRTSEGQGPEKDQAAGGERAEAAAGAPAVAAPPAAKAEQRKIVYTGHLDLIVDDFDLAANTLVELLKERDGHIDHWDIQGTPGVPRTGTWTLRIPAARFDDFLHEARRVGDLRRSKIDSDDITDRYFDIKAEIKNLEAREEALRTLYKEKLAGSDLNSL